MGTKEILSRLQILPLVEAVYKIGGKQIGPISRINILQSIFGYFVLMGGRPMGLVFSAPEGFTRSLGEILDLRISGHHVEVRKKFYETLETLLVAWRGLREELSQEIPEGYQMAYRREMLAVEQHVLSSIEDFKTQIETVLKLENALEPGRVEAFVLSIGERSFGEILILPTCKILTKFHGMNFVYLDPLFHISPKASEVVAFTNLVPDVRLSSMSLQSAIGEVDTYAKSPVTYVMPGFYMHANADYGIGTMPFNGSDMSAYILSLAFGPDPINLWYAKQVDRPLPESVTALIEAQEREPLVDGKRPELVATSVLYELRDAGRGLNLFDTRTNKRLYLPAGERVEAK